MVDFTKPVNNADMIERLNVLIRANLVLSAYYEHDLSSRASPECVEVINEALDECREALQVVGARGARA